jgi:hypothetical protein
MSEEADGSDGVINGEVSVGGGWWLELPRAYGLDYDEDDLLVLERSVVRVQPEVFAVDGGEQAEAIVDELVSEAVTAAPGRLQDLGRLTGRGWVGRWCAGPAVHGEDEFELLAALAATPPDDDGTVLNLTIHHVGATMGDEARWLVEHAAHRAAY